MEILQMALVGYRAEREKIQAKIEEIEQKLGGRRSLPAAADSAAPRSRTMSAAAIARIRAAQKKRWAEFRKRQAKNAPPAQKSAARKGAAAPAPAKPKRKISASQRAALVERLKKARAAKAAKNNAEQAS
jgi:hypothetical protein